MGCVCRDNILTHIQGFGADYENMDQIKEELTAYLCHEHTDPSLLMTTTTMYRWNVDEEGWGCGWML